MPKGECTSDYAAFSPSEYLQEYYGDIGTENLALLRFLVRTLRCAAPSHVMLDFGGGPTVYAPIAAAPRVAEMHLSDYSETNLAEVRRWLRGDQNAFDWTKFTRAVLVLEGENASPDGVRRREELTRRRVSRLLHCDARVPCPVEGGGGLYDLLITNFCAEAAARDKVEWHHCMDTICSLLRPGGRLVVSAVKGAASYSVGDTDYLAVRILEDDLVDLLGGLGFLRETIVVDSVAADRLGRRYEGLMFATAVKRADPCT